MKISDNTIRQAIDDGLAGISLSPGQKAAILAQCRPAPLRVRRGRALKRALTVAAVFALSVATSAGVLASSPALAHQLSVLGAQTMQFLQPVNLSCEQNGIRMEVLAAMRGGDTAVIYLSLRDTTGQGRLRGEIDLRDYQVAGADLSFCYPVSYNEAAGEAIVCLTGEGLTGSKLTVTLGGLLAGRTDMAPAPTGYSVADLQRLFPDPVLEYPQDVASWTIWGEGMDGYNTRLSNGQMPLLKPQCSYVPPKTPWVTFQAAGLVGNELHLRLEQDGQMGRFNTLSLSLAAPGVDMTDATGATVQLPAEAPQQPAGLSTLQEYVLTLPQSVPLDQVELYASGTVYEEYVEGGWSVTFWLEDAPASLSGSCPVDMGGWAVDTVSLSPVGVLISGTGEMYADSRDLTVEVLLRDGTQAQFLSSSTTTSQGQVVMRMLFDVPLAPEDVASVTVCGVPVQWAS